ncbi:MAG: AraC family transcriptional regulator N-terminal domain-containing protein [Colwellia sp.]|uniref:helix-turn-helix domain-containing protein n=1 Tax=Colwellia sp. TaxID=56799 RepID=UPI001E10F666|nr:helix-turn-helix domain-containing protein [Colwellia sp.]NQY50144.1 AraC family transcriptional regulator N-terminal domain-containing protein [Colwellia sp.]
MITQAIDSVRNPPKVLVENKLSFAGPESELSIYDTYQQAEKVKLQSDQLLFCAMVTGKKVMHSTLDNFHGEFLPHESFIMAPGSSVEIDFPIAQISQPTTCLAIEISSERVQQVSAMLNQQQPLNQAFGHWQYDNKLVHTHHNRETQSVLNRIVHIYTENHPDRSAMVALAVSELTIRLLHQQTREFILAFSQQEPDHNGLNAAINQIELHLNESLSIDELARISCMSRTKFFHEFKVHLGCSPMVYQLQSRLKKAGKLLKQGQQITQTCFALGFTNTSHFSRCFKKFYGISPRQYKERYLTRLA